MKMKTRKQIGKLMSKTAWGRWDWSEQGGTQWSEWSRGSWRSKEYEPPSTWDTSNEIFIPEFLAGFLLLNRSGLDSHEKNNVLAAIRGGFDTTTVARALREQWPDDELAKRDRSRAASAMMAEEDEMGDEDAMMVDDMAGELENMSRDEREAFLAEQERAEAALAAIQTQKTTLKEARWKQKQLRMGRGFYPPKPYQRETNKGNFGDKKKGGCFRCGGDHLIRDCPQKPKQAQVASEEAAEIAFVVSQVTDKSEEQCYTGDPVQEAHTGERVLESCMGIIDSGATASLGSAEALEMVMQDILRAHGDSLMSIDTSRKPTFRFGNGQKRECISTVGMKIGAGNKQGSMTIHVHDTPGQPVLISRKALGALGAGIDFEEKVAVYKNVDATRVVRLEEAENGHLLMPLTGNILVKSEGRETPFVSLRSE